MNALSDNLLSFAHAIVRGEAPSREIDPSYAKYSASIAIEVYRNNYRGNLHDALAGAYPVIEQLVGKDFFRLLTRSYIEQHPSRSGNLHRYGEQLGPFVATFPPAKLLVYLAEVAALEWACHLAYFAPDAPMPDIQMLAQLEPEQYSRLTLLSHPATHVVRSSYPIAAIWQAHQPGSPEDFHIDLDSGPCVALVTRMHDVVQVSELTEAEAAWLSEIRAGIALGIATDNVLGSYPDFDVQAALANLMSLSAFTGFKVGESS